MHGYLSGIAVWYYLLFIFFVVIISLQRKITKGYMEKSWKNQEKMIALLTEIRDSLKK